MIMPSKRGLARILAPESEPITLEQAKLYLRVDHSEEDILINGFIISARSIAEEYLHKSLLPQQWKLSFNDYAPNELRLSRPPIQGVNSVASVAHNGDETVISADHYFLSVDNETLVLDQIVYGHNVEITYTAGYANIDDIPKPIIYGMLAHIAALYENRGDGTAAIPKQSVALYAPFRELRI